MNTFSAYGKFMHWLIFILFSLQFVMANIMENLDKDGSLMGISKWGWYDWHKTGGMILLILGLARIYWRITTRLPDWKVPLSKLEGKVVSIAEWSLTIGMVLLSLSGFLMSSFGGYPVRFMGLFELPLIVSKSEAAGEFFEGMHELMATLMMILVVLHLLFALKRHFVDKDGYLNRMLPGKSQ